MCEEFFAEQSINTKRAIIDVLIELNKAVDKHPEWPKDPIHAAAIVSEESGELVRASLQFTYENGKPSDMNEEAVQTAAMGIRFLLNNHLF